MLFDAKLRSINVYIIVGGITVPIEIAAMEFPFEVRIRIREDNKVLACCQFIFSCNWPHTDIFTSAIPFPTIFFWHYVLCARSIVVCVILRRQLVYLYVCTYPV